MRLMNQTRAYCTSRNYISCKSLLNIVNCVVSSMFTWSKFHGLKYEVLLKLELSTVQSPKILHEEKITVTKGL